MPAKRPRCGRPPKVNGQVVWNTIGVHAETHRQFMVFVDHMKIFKENPLFSQNDGVTELLK